MVSTVGLGMPHAATKAQNRILVMGLMNRRGATCRPSDRGLIHGAGRDRRCNAFGSTNDVRPEVTARERHACGVSSVRHLYRAVPDDDFRQLLDAFARPTYVFDRETLAFSYVNDAACAYYGWTRDELLSMTIRDIRPRSELPRLERALAEWQGEHQRLSAKHMSKDGRLLDVELDVSRVEFRGRPASLAVIRDVTGAEEAARRFRTLVEYSASGTSLIDEKAIILYMSPAAERILGVAPGELVGKSVRYETHPDDIARVVTPKPGETRDYVTRVRHRNGSWRWIETTTTNLTQDTSVRAYVSSFRDVTDRVEAEAQLRRSETNFRTLIERSLTLVLVHRDGIVRYVNPPTVAALRYDSADQIVGQTIMGLVHPDDRAAVGERMARTLKDGGGAPGTARMRRRDGTYVATEGEGVMLDFDGEPSNVVLGRDVTERNEMFARIAIADRLASVGVLAAGVAHEINNPLSYVMSNLAVLADELPALIAGVSRLSREDVETLVADAREGTARVSAIVRDLRSLSRTDDVTTEPVDVAAVLASSIKIASNEARYRARVVTAIDPNMPRVRANASRLGQVFLNLLVNAAHAIEEGHPLDNEIRVRAYADASHVVVEVEDTGVGIPASVIGRIFDPFFTTKPIGVGTGLGLAISHEIVRSIDGTIRVESTPGRGSIFRVSLPASAEVATPAPKAEFTPIVARARVLMIDDQIGMGRSTRLLMSREYDITPVTRAEDALERIAKGEQYDAIVCDLMMPEMSGVEFHEQLEKVSPAYAKRVVFITGGAFTERARAFLQETRQPHLEKPFTEHALRAAIERVLA